jgi:hypothetical protein
MSQVKINKNRKYKAIAKITTYAEIEITAESGKGAYEIADNMDVDDFNEIIGAGGWTISVTPCDDALEKEEVHHEEVLKPNAV